MVQALLVHGDNAQETDVLLYFMYLVLDSMAVLYYTSWWDFVGIKIKIVGMDPNCCHPNP